MLIRNAVDIFVEKKKRLCKNGSKTEIRVFVYSLHVPVSKSRIRPTGSKIAEFFVDDDVGKSMRCDSLFFVVVVVLHTDRRIRLVGCDRIARFGTHATYTTDEPCSERTRM